MEYKNLITAREACKLLDVFPATFYRAKSEGRIPGGVKIGKRVFFLRDEIMALPDIRLKPRKRKGQ